MTGRRSILGLLVALALVAFLWWTQGDDAAQQRTGQDPGTNQGPARQGERVDELPTVALDDLPPEAAETLDLIDAGGPFPHDRDGVTFENREELLPDQPRGYYAEYTVPTPGSDDRGARRIVVGEGGELYWTADHYTSFSAIARS